MFDLKQTQKWVMAVLSDADGAAAAYRDPLAGWQSTFVQITLPVTVAAYVVAALLGWMTGGAAFMLGSPLLFLVATIWALVWTLLVAFIFDLLAGTFDGERNFDAAYAVVALALIPSALGTAVSPLPWLGWLISLAASVYSLILAYRFLPQYLRIPEDSRVKHFALSVVAAIVVNFVVMMTIGAQMGPSIEERIKEAVEARGDVSGAAGSGMFGGLERQAQMSEAAANDRYEPPAHGRLSRAQVARYVDNMEKTHALRQRLDAELSEKYAQDKPGITDIFGGIGGMARLGTAEMEVVKSAGGNWAEHQWVKSQIEAARIHQDLNDATQHNFSLYQEIEPRLTALN